MEQQRLPLPPTASRVQTPSSRLHDTQPPLAAPVELDLAQLVHVSGGTATTTQAPHGRW